MKNLAVSERWCKDSNAYKKKELTGFLYEIPII